MDYENNSRVKSSTVTITRDFEQSTTLFCNTLYSFLRTISSITVVILIKESCKCTYQGFYSLGLMALNNSGNLQYSSFFRQYSEKSKHTKAISPDVNERKKKKKKRVVQSRNTNIYLTHF